MGVTQIYAGPTLPDEGLQQFDVFMDGVIPAYLQPLMSSNKDVDLLTVAMEQFSDVYVAAGTPGTPENAAYLRLSNNVAPPTEDGDMLKSVYDLNNDGIVDQATKLQVARMISLTGDVTGSAAFDGSANAAIQSTVPIATPSVKGLLSAADKAKLDGVANGATNYVHPATHPATMITDDAGHRFVSDSEKAAWNAKGDMQRSIYDTDIDGVVDQAEKLLTARTIAINGDATGTTSFDGSADVSINMVIPTVTPNAKGLMSVADKAKLDGVAPGANNYTHPATHPATMITEDAAHRFVTDSEKATWNAAANKPDYDSNNDGIVDKAEKLATARNITLTGTVNGSAAFDGSSNVTITTTGGGDMLRSTYDTNNDGTVDKAAKLATARTISLTGSVTGSASFDGSTNITITTTGNGGGSGSGGNVINVKSYGAVGDGVADDTSEINAAIAAAAAKGGGIVFLPAGTYIISSKISIPSFVHLMGEGAGITTIRLQNGVNSDMIDIGTSSDCGVSDLSIRGNQWSPNPATNKTGLNIGRAGLDGSSGNGNSENLIIRDVTIRDIGGDGFHCFPNTWIYSLTRVRIEYCAGYGLYVQSTDNMYDNMQIVACGKNGIYASGANNRFSNMKVIFCGRGADLMGSTGTDTTNAGIYVAGKRSAFTNIECQENYGHGWVFDGAQDIDIVGCLSDANGYSMISNSRAASAFGWYFRGAAQRISGIIKSTIFKSTISQLKGYQIDAGCANINLMYENDHAQNDTNNSPASCVVVTAKNMADIVLLTNYVARKQATDFLTSGITLTNAIASYDNTYFNLSSSMLSSYTINTNEVFGRTNWAATPRLGTRYVATTAGRTFLVRVKVKPTINNYNIRLTALYDEASYNLAVPSIDGTYSSSVYTDISFTFTADRNSTKLTVYLEDKYGSGTNPNAAQGAFYAREFAIVDITDPLAQYYTVSCLDTVVKNNYFTGSRIFTS